MDTVSSYPRVVALVLACGVLSAPGDAQTAVPRLGEYSRIRLISDSTTQWTMGWVTGLTAGDLRLRNQFGTEVEVPLPSIRQFEIRRGTRMREGAIIGVALGVGLGLVAGESAGMKFAIGGTAAASLGISLASAARQYPRWVNVDIGLIQASVPRSIPTLAVFRFRF